MLCENSLQDFFVQFYLSSSLSLKSKCQRTRVLLDRNCRIRSSFQNKHQRLVFQRREQGGNVTKATWAGKTLVADWTMISLDDKKADGRCTWEYNADHTTVKGQCEIQTDGKWWEYRKLIGAKAKAQTK